MFKKLNEKSFRGLFEDLGIKQFQIPQYQRIYVWDKDKVSNLLNGIIKAYEMKMRYYFMGSIVLCKGDNDTGTYLVVDGQQRLTSITIIVSTIRYVAFENEYHKIADRCERFIRTTIIKPELDELKYKLLIPDTANMNYGTEFRRYIQATCRETKTNAQGICELKKFLSSESDHSALTQYVNRLKRIFDALYDQIFEFNEKQLEDLLYFIYRKCRFVLMISDDFFDAHRIFCTLNISGEPLSPLDTFKAQFYGHLVKENGVTKASRVIDTKLRTWNEINSKLGSYGMLDFLSHVYRLKMIEKNNKNEFLTSYCSSSLNELAKFFESNSKNSQSCEQFLIELKTFYQIWQKIFHLDSFQSKLALKLLKWKHWSVWVTIVMAAAYKGIELTNSFWAHLEVFMTRMLILLCSRDENDENELLLRCFDVIFDIFSSSKFNFDFEKSEIGFIFKQLKGDIYSKLNNFSIKYLLLRYCLNMKPCKQEYNIDRVNIDFYYTNNGNKKEQLSMYEGYLGNLIIVNAKNYRQFQKKNWNEKKKLVNLVKLYPLTEKVFEENIWSFDTFKKFHLKYLKFFVNLLDLQEFENYELNQVRTPTTVTNNPLKRTISSDVDKDKTAKRMKFSDSDAELAAKKMSIHLKNNNTSDKNLILIACQSIDPNGTAYTNNATMLKVLLTLQKKHKVYYRKWFSTFKQWIEKCSSKDRCNYVDLFMLNS